MEKFRGCSYSRENFRDWRLIRENRESFPPRTICISYMVCFQVSQLFFPEIRLIHLAIIIEITPTKIAPLTKLPRKLIIIGITRQNKACRSCKQMYSK